MRKLFAAILSLLCLLSVACAHKKYELAWDGFCYSLSDNCEIALSAEEKGYIIDLMNGGEWTKGAANCLSDHVFYTKSQTVRYHSDCGTFADVTSGTILKVGEEDRLKINAILRRDKKTEPQ